MINKILSQDSSIIDFVESTNAFYISGALYWDANQRQFKIVDSAGNSSTVPVGYDTVTIGQRLQNIISWVEAKQQEEFEVKALCEQYPNLADAKREYDSLLNLIKNQ